MKRLLLVLLLSCAGFAQTRINPSQVRAPSGTASVTQFLTCVPSGTCAFAQGGVVPNPQTGTTYTIATTDRLKYVSFNNGSAIAVTLPQAGTSGFANNFAFAAHNIGNGLVTVTPTTSTINGAATQIIPKNWFGFHYSDNTNYFAPVMPTIAAFPNCTDSGGNHINYTSATGAFSCGTSGGSSGRADYSLHAVSASASCAGSGNFLGINSYSGCGTGSEANVQMPMPNAGTASHLQVNSSVAAGAAQSWTITVRQNGASSALTCQISGASATSCNDTTHSFTFVETDLLDWRIDGSAGPASAWLNMSFKIAP